ncbi:MAG: hypothetical protein KTR32_09675, partial [Granulosicoccus sp.]|nr:hypothetical protein [Granulosicoccus sp.]
TTGLATGYAIAAAEEELIDDLEESEEVYETRFHDSQILDRISDTTHNKSESENISAQDQPGNNDS